MWLRGKGEADRGFTGGGGESVALALEGPAQEDQPLAARALW